MRFSNRQRLRRKAEFEKVRHSGIHKECGPFLLQIQSFAEADRPTVRRIGVITGKRLGNAVLRNRCRRRLRELFSL
ncbi:MAG: ribonuclease P protein component [Verrucomicrobia bacterium]|nr:ribonuclease P protein component [Verrucomicrobiota bacterium]